MTDDIITDAVELWKQESRGFLDYVVAISSPVSTNEVDEAVLAAFQEFHEDELPLLKRLYSVLTRLGLRADRPPHGLFSAQYNFLRPEVLGSVFCRIAAVEISSMETMLGRYQDATDLERRLFRGLLEDWIGLRGGSVKKIEKILADAEKARLAAAGEEVEEEEPAEATGAADEEFPWHDEDLEIDARMKLAEGRSLFEKLFAAMAQTDCTACGYDCEGYARAIAEGEDKDLGKCAPGEQETEEMLQDLVKK